MITTEKKHKNVTASRCVGPMTTNRFSLTLLFSGLWEAIVFIEIKERVTAQP